MEAPSKVLTVDYIREFLIYAYIVNVEYEYMNFEYLFSGVTKEMIKHWKTSSSPYKKLISLADARDGECYLAKEDYPENIKKEADERVENFYSLRSHDMCNWY